MAMPWLCLDLAVLDIRWPLLFFPESDFIYNSLHVVQKWTKNQCGKLKKFQDFCLPDIKSCHRAATWCVKLWLLNTNLFFNEPHQLTKFTQLVHLNNIWQRTFHFKDLTAIFLGLQTQALLANEARFFQIWGDLPGMFSPKRSRWPPFFFYIFDITKSSSYTGKSLRKKVKLENFRANVLKIHKNITLWC